MDALYILEEIPKYDKTVQIYTFISLDNKWKISMFTYEKVTDIEKVSWCTNQSKWYRVLVWQGF